MIKDKDIRNKFIFENRIFLNSGIFINEYDLEGKSRVDFCLYKDGFLYGYEIKSEADNLKRMIPQLRNYLKYFDYLYLLIFDNHVEDVRRVLDKFNLNRVGLISIDKNICFKLENKPQLNNKISRLGSFLRNLKREDLTSICNTKNIKPYNFSKDSLINALVGKITLEEIIPIFENRLKTYVSTCNKCGFKLMYKTKVIRKREFKNTTVSCKVKKCFLCGYEKELG